jgi:8-oxo-dGTP pyrophosphatase MutT (NUDIX family)
MLDTTYCNNCGKPGHIYSQCKIPITSFGVIAFRMNKENVMQFLMIRRKDTLGYIDFMRGKYLVQNKYYILNMIKQMTIEEKEHLKTGDFDKMWKILWGENTTCNKYKTEEMISREKFNILVNGVVNKNEFFTLSTLVDESNTHWEEPEWGFPKGRRNYHEKDYDCAIREFSEETGYSPSMLKNIHNIYPFDEIFTGSNYKSYKHTYYLMYMDYDASCFPAKYEECEVSKMDWKTYEECIECIRPYNLEKKNMLTNIHKCLQKYMLFIS